MSRYGSDDPFYRVLDEKVREAHHERITGREADARPLPLDAPVGTRVWVTSSAFEGKPYAAVTTHVPWGLDFEVGMRLVTVPRPCA